MLLPPRVGVDPSQSRIYRRRRNHEPSGFDRPRPDSHQHPPFSGCGHGREGQLRTSGCSHGPGRHGLRLVDPYPAPRSAGPEVAEPGSICPLLRPRLGAALLSTPPQRLRPVDGDLQSFRQLDSKTPGHPEYDLDHGVETTTGPLGQGLSNASAWPSPSDSSPTTSIATSSRSSTITSGSSPATATSWKVWRPRLRPSRVISVWES